MHEKLEEVGLLVGADLELSRGHYVVDAVLSGEPEGEPREVHLLDHGRIVEGGTLDVEGVLDPAAHCEKGSCWW